MITLNILSLCNWPMYLLAWFLPFILGLIFGRSFLGKHKKNITELEQKSTQLNSRASSLKADLEAARKAKSNVDREIKLLQGQLQDKNDRIKSSESRVLLLKKQHDEKIENFKTKLENQIKSIQEKDNSIKTLKAKIDLSETKLKRIEKQLRNENNQQIEFESKQEVKPIRINDEEINRILDQQATRSDAESNMKEVDRVKSALSAASLGKVDKILEKIERKKKKAKLKQQSQKSMVEVSQDISESSKITSFDSSSIEVLPPTPEQLEQRRRGRPKGSKNKATLERELGRGRRRDNLKKIEGIGPKIEEALRKIGYKTFKKIASSTPQELKEALVRESTRFKIASTENWPQQAKLAYEDKWNELKKKQDDLDLS